MKKLKHNFKKGMAFVLSLAMVAGLVPAMSGGANKVQAASGSGTEPSVSAYATKTQLMDGTFAPNAEGTAENYGKLVFGKNSSGNPQEWYILGADSKVSGGTNNTIIFAANPITGKKFNSSTSNKSFASSFGVYASNPSEVYPNHYGASDIRVALQRMATNTNYFTTAEQGLMNATTVTTKDTKNSSVTYTTTDKLYALQGDFDNDQYLWAGTDDSTVLARSSYWRNGDLFWLRSPYDDNVSGALLADPGMYVSYRSVLNGCAVQPASNLDLSSVLFASAATAASSDTKSEKITDSAAMTLRLDGTGKDIGTVTYNTTTGDIKAVKGTTSQTVALVVQGNDGTNDWYYSKQITGTETINASDIKSALSLTSDIDLSACKIWLEATDTDGMIYAINATNVYALTVTNGSGTGEYEQGATVTITADTATSGQQFKEWEVVSGTITLADSMRETTTFTMPAEAVSVKANYEVIPVTEYTITSTTGANGSISPSGTVKVVSGGSQTFTITPATGYEIDTLKVDGSAVSSVTSYTFNNVDKAHTIEATFKKKQSPEPTPTSYKIISGADSEWKQNTDGNITIRGNGEFSKFESVKVDGSIIDAKNYTAKEGSTIIILKADYLKTLSVGTHSFEIVWTDGSAVTNFKVSKNTDDSQQPTPPQTGDNSRPMLWVTLLAASLAGLLALLVVRRKKDDKYMQR